MKKIAIVIGLILCFSNSIMAVEERHFDLVKKEGAIEIRHYAPVIAAEIRTSGTRNEAANAAFRVLVKFIGGENASALKIPMTSPVTQQRDTEDTWFVSFYMPADMTMDQMPQPSDNAIQVKPLQNMKVAAIRFSGRGSANNLDKHEKRLRQYLAGTEYTIISKPSYAFYNPPFVPWFLRRNEVLFEIK